MTGGANEATQEDREETGGVPEEEERWQKKERKEEMRGKGKPEGGKDTTDTGRRRAEKRSRRIQGDRRHTRGHPRQKPERLQTETPETPDHGQDASQQGPPKAWQNPRSLLEHKVRYPDPDPPNIHTENKTTRANRRPNYLQWQYHGPPRP